MFILNFIVAVLLQVTVDAFYLPPYSYPMAPYSYMPPPMPPPMPMYAPPYMIPLMPPPSVVLSQTQPSSNSNPLDALSLMAQAPKAQPFTPPPGVQAPQPPAKPANPDLLTLKLPLYGSEAVLSDENTKESPVRRLPDPVYGVRQPVGF